MGSYRGWKCCGIWISGVARPRDIAAVDDRGRAVARSQARSTHVHQPRSGATASASWYRSTAASTGGLSIAGRNAPCSCSLTTRSGPRRRDQRDTWLFKLQARIEAKQPKAMATARRQLPRFTVSVTLCHEAISRALTFSPTRQQLHIDKEISCHEQTSRPNPAHQRQCDCSWRCCRRRSGGDR